MRRPCFGGPFVIQWHLDDRCNLSCTHCYRPEGGIRPSTDAAQRRAMLEEFLTFLESLGQPGRLHLAGGEPLLLPDLCDLVERAKARGVGCRVLSNGTLVTEDLARDLARVGVLGVQVSLEGREATHDAIRGAGSYQRALEGVRSLRQAGVQVTLSMTVHRQNVGDLEALWGVACAEADRFYVSRLVPAGRAASLSTLDRRAWGKVQRRLLGLRTEGTPELALRDPTYRPLHAAPWKAARAPIVAGCAAGFQTLTVESDGTIMPCRRMNLALGRMGEGSLLELWKTHPLLQALRDRDRLKGACGRCAYRWVCGGCRAFPAVLSGDPLGADPQCPHGTIPGRLRVLRRHTLSALQNWLMR